MVKHVENCGESGVEHAVLNQDRYLDVGNSIKRGVSTTYRFTCPHLASWCAGRIPVRLGVKTLPRNHARKVDMHLEVTIIPVLLGVGVPLLPGPAQRKQLHLQEHKIYPSGTAHLIYEVQR